MIHHRCPGCGAELETPEHLAGSRCSCPICREILEAPQLDGTTKQPADLEAAAVAPVVQSLPAEFGIREKFTVGCLGLFCLVLAVVLWVLVFSNSAPPSDNSRRLTVRQKFLNDLLGTDGWDLAGAVMFSALAILCFVGLYFGSRRRRAPINK